MNTLPESKRRFDIEGNQKGISISNQELISHGCRNCIWRLHKQCKHDIVSDTDFYEYTDELTSEDGATKKVKYSGYCPEYVSFLLSFAEDTNSTSALWERFSLYIARMQSLDDYKKYIELKDKLEMMEVEGASLKDRGRFEHKKEILRLYWERLNDTVRKGYARIADREARSKDSRSGMAGIMNAKTINFNITKQIEDKKE